MIDRIIAPLARVLDVLLPARCAACGLAAGVFCAACEASLSALQGIARAAGGPMPPVVALGSYDGLLRSAVLAIKFRGARSAATRLGDWLAPLVRWEVAAIVAVPLHPRRLRERGYNQAREIARGIAAVRRVPLVDGALVRIKSTAPQSGLDLANRGKNVAGAFGSTPRAGALDGKPVLLVDDVVTTGATARACAATLRSAGAGDIYLAAVAIRL
jgi:ComF family protein